MIYQDVRFIFSSFLDIKPNARHDCSLRLEDLPEFRDLYRIKAEIVIQDNGYIL